jgi:hypothetical protein
MFVVLFTLEFTTAGEFSSSSPPESFYGWLHHGGCIDTHELNHPRRKLGFLSHG